MSEVLTLIIVAPSEKQLVCSKSQATPAAGRWLLYWTDSMQILPFQLEYVESPEVI